MDSVPSCRCSHLGRTGPVSTLVPVLSGVSFHSPEEGKEGEREGGRGREEGRRGKWEDKKGGGRRREGGGGREGGIMTECES